MALISFGEWRGQRGEPIPGNDKRKTGGRPKGTWVGGNPRFGKERGTNTGTTNISHTRQAQNQIAKDEIEQGLADMDD